MFIANPPSNFNHKSPLPETKEAALKLGAFQGYLDRIGDYDKFTAALTLKERDAAQAWDGVEYLNQYLPDNLKARHLTPGGDRIARHCKISRPMAEAVSLISDMHKGAR